MSNRAALYLRSSKDRSDISIDAQRRGLHELAASKSLVVMEEFADAVESGKDDDRPGFQALLRALKQPDRGWENVLVLDTSRIARRRHLALIFEHECDKANIRIHFKNVPDSDPITGMLLKSILQAMDEWHSLTSKAKGLAGMAENVRQGWRAGGRAPRGYRLDYHSTGAVRDGAPVLKSRLVPNEDADVVKAYLVGRAAGKPRGDLMTQLKIDWPATSLNSMEWQALTYAGHTVWNVQNEMTRSGYKGGEKRKPRAEWMVTRDTHPPLITDEQAERILDQLERQKVRKVGNTERAYLLTGFLVTPDGQAWHGEWDKKSDSALYRVGKGRKIAARRIDSVVVQKVMADLQSDEVVEKIIESIRGLTEEPVDGRKIAGLEKKLASATAKVARLVDLLTDADGAVADAYKRAIAQAETERAGLIEELGTLRTMASQQRTVQALSAADVRALLRLLADDMMAGVEAGEARTIKAALGGFIDKIVLDPVTEECAIHFQIAPPETGVKMASPRGDHHTPVVWIGNVALLDRWAA